MTKKKLYRWRCPICSDGVLLPKGLHKTNSKRYCLPCSEETGKLVERVSPVLVKLRVEQKARSQKKAQKRKVAKRKKDDDRFIVHGFDTRIVTRKMIELPSMKISYPDLHVRHSKLPQAYTSGHAWYGEHRIVVTYYPKQSVKEFLHTLLHELVHLKVGYRNGEHHGEEYQRKFYEAATDWNNSVYRKGKKLPEISRNWRGWEVEPPAAQLPGGSLSTNQPE